VRSAISRNTGATTSQVGQARFTMATRPDGRRGASGAWALDIGTSWSPAFYGENPSAFERFFEGPCGSD
jgi:hypothetical protein